jgi:ribulose-phosphate 3-epimerase
MNEIIPSIIPINYSLLRERLVKVIGLAKRVQIDVVDSLYAPPTTWPFSDAQRDHLMNMVRNDEKLPYVDDFVFEIDMMVLHPIEYISDFLSIGAKSFVIHIDSTDHVKECVQTIKSAGAEVGIGIKPSISETLLLPYLPDIDFVQFMGNDRVGFSGVELDRNVLKKINEFHDAHGIVPIQIDIGVNAETLPKLKDAGASRFVCGSSLFTAPDTKVAFHDLQSL